MNWAGLVDLRDLNAYPWSPRHLPQRLASLGLVPQGPIFQSFLPPDRLVVIAPALASEMVARHAGWLSLAASVLLVRDFEGEPLDSDLQELLEEEWAPVLARLGNVAVCFDCAPGPVGAIEVALDRALDLGPATERPLPRPPPVRSWRRGPWLPVAGELDRESLAPRLCAPDTGPALVLDEGLRSLLEETSEPIALPLLPVAASRDGKLRLAREGLLSADGERLWEPASHMGFPVGLDPVHPLGTAGHRCIFHWYLSQGTAFSELCICAHEWPCGHAKKLWGYKNNRPVSVAVAPDASAYVSTFEHDAIVSSQVPMRWQLAGEIAVAAWPPEVGSDPLRALFFCTGDIPWEPGDPLTGDEDLRASSPVVVLGPSAGCRYAVDLSQPTYRLRGDQGQALDQGGYAVYDEAHALVRRGEGRLLGGWFQWATVLHQDRLWREDLATGEREDLGPAEREIDWAVAVPGTPHVVVVAGGALQLS